MMATSNLTFLDWKNKTNANLMSTAEELLEKLEDTSELLSEINGTFVLTRCEEGKEDEDKGSIIQRFHEGVDSARDLVNVLKREKWRLSKRLMSVEMTMGELEDYKKHLKDDVSALNQTVEVLSLRVIQLENQLAEAQDKQESLEAELEQHRNSLLSANDRNIQLYTENEDLKKAMKELQKSTVMKENQMLKDEVTMLTQENRNLKDMVRDAEAKCPPFMQRKPILAPQSPPSPAAAQKDDNLAKLRREFLEELTSLELSQRAAAAAKSKASGAASAGPAAATTLRKIPIMNIQADV